MQIVSHREEKVECDFLMSFTKSTKCVWQFGQFWKRSEKLLEVKFLLHTCNVWNTYQISFQVKTAYLKIVNFFWKWKIFSSFLWNKINDIFLRLNIFVSSSMILSTFWIFSKILWISFLRSLLEWYSQIFSNNGSLCKLWKIYVGLFFIK